MSFWQRTTRLRYELLCLLCVLSPQGKAAEPQIDPHGTFRDHGQVCRNFRCYWPTGQLCFDRNLGREILLVVDNAGRLLANDFSTGKTTPYPLPVRGSAWHAKRAADGTLWMGLGFGKAELVRFDPTQRKYLPVTPRPTEARATRIISDVTEGTDGKIYYSTAPQAQLWRYDPKKKTHQLLVKRIDHGNKYPYCITTGFGGRIFIAMASDHDRLWCYDPNNGQLTNMTPKRFQAPGHWERPVAVGKWILYPWYDRLKNQVQLHLYDGQRLEFVKATVLPNHKHYTGDNSNLIELSPGKVAVKVARGRFREVSLPSLRLSGGFNLEDAHGQMLVRATRDGQLVTGWGQEYGVVPKGDNRIRWRLPNTQPTPHAIFALHGHQDGRVYGSAEVGNTIFWFDPKTGKTTNTGQVTDTSGEVYGFCAHAGKIYMASYTWAVITVYDPKKPWRPGENVGSNPRTLGRIGNDQYRPVGGIHRGPGGQLVVGTAPNYGIKGGAFTLIDPPTDRLRVYRNQVPRGTVNEFATDGQVLFGYGGGELFVFDPTVNKIVFRRKMPGGPMVYANGRLNMVSRSNLVQFHPQRRTFATVLGVSFNGVPRHSLKVDGQGHLWAISAKTLTRIDLKTRQQTLFGKTRGKAYAHLTATPDGTWWFTSPDKMRLRSFTERTNRE